jgi:hypothetical protein
MNNVLQNAVAAFESCNTPFERITYGNSNLESIARAVCATGLKADTAFRAHGHVLVKPLPEIIDENVETNSVRYRYSGYKLDH